jgi:Fur family ferric uptake transcriptional regulator
MVLKVMIEAKGHLTPDDVLYAANKLLGKQKLGKATVYRALNLFEEEGIVTSISFGIEGKKYELNLHKHHDHMICNSCGDITEFYSEEMENIQDKIALEHGFKITSHAMQLFGLCSSCATKKVNKKA